MSDILRKIIADKREQVDLEKQQTSIDQFKDQINNLPRPRNFYKAVTKPNPRGINVIAEVKKASPSAGLIRPGFDPVQIARIYEKCGADAISVLTDEKYFQGKLEYLTQVKEAVKLPILRKDFIIDIWQIYQARAAGADAILLIADALSEATLVDFMIEAAELNLTCLVEVHDAETLMLLRSVIGFPRKGYSVLGVNNRNLKTMQVDINTTARLAALLENTNELITESGIKTREDVRKMKKVGAKAILIGQTLCENEDIEAKFRELFEI